LGKPGLGGVPPVLVASSSRARGTLTVTRRVSRSTRTAGAAGAALKRSS
jgi:hypothetical protein